MSLIKCVIAFAAAMPIVMGAGLAQSGESAGDEVVNAPSETASPPAEEPAASPDAEKQASAAGAEKKADPNKKICKHIARTGSRFGTKVCMTRAEWDQSRKDAQAAAADIQRRNSAAGSSQ